MFMRSLEAYSVPSVVLDAWERTCGKALLPVQERAVRAGVLSGRSLLVSAPTSSGKTFVGEMAGIHAALSGRKVVYLVPTKALAEAKYRRFRARYEAVGLRVAIATRDRRHQQEQVARGEFDLLVAVPEKMRAMLAERSAMAGMIGAVVADELQVLGDAERGPCLELLLGDLIAESPDLQVVGLSAVLGEAERLAEWLGAELVREERRPVELRRGVLDGAEYHFRQHNDGAEGIERWEELADGPVDAGERMAQVAAWLAERDGATLVFVRDKRTAVQMAEAIAQVAELPAAERTEGQLAALEETRATQALRELAGAGVAFHTADLRFDEREVIEAGFDCGDLSVLVCTSTLAMGVNLPARNVVVDVRRWCSTGSGGKPMLGAIGRAEFENMAGRAGRLGCSGSTPEVGRAVLIAEGEVQRQVLLATYLDGALPALRPQLGAQTPLQHVCLLSGSAGAVRAGGLAEAWRRSLSAREAGLPPDVLPSELREALDVAAAHGLVEESVGEWRPTAIGALCGTSGLTARSFLALLRAARKAEGVAPAEPEALLAAALTDEAQAIPLPPPGWGAALADEFADAAAPCDDHWELERLLETAGKVAAGSAPALRRERAARVVLAMRHWLGPEETAEVEARTRIPAGRLAVLAEAVGWAVQVLARIGRELDWPREQWHGLTRLGESVAAGVPEQGLALHELHVPGLGRGHIRALLREGLTTRAAIAHAEPRALERLLGPTLAARALAIACGVPVAPELDRRAEPLRVELPSPRALAPQTAPTPGLVIEADRPDRVLLDGRPIELRPAEFRLLCVLADTPRACVDYEAIYEGMWGDEAFVEPAQIYSHRSRLAGKFGEAVPGGADLLRTIPKRGIMLDLPPEQVRVR
jgi:helicase